MSNRITKTLFALFLFFIAFFGQAKVILGIDVLQSVNFEPLKNKRVGLLTHPAGVNCLGRSTVDIFHKTPLVNLRALYGPEHGIYGDELADVPVADRIDKRTNLPVYSLYGKYRKPTPEMLKGIDVMVVDLQDIGVRSYTYVSCMLRTLEACFENGKEVVILDRPNPLGGLKVDGPILDMEFKSYVGMFPAPYVHGLTIAEIALMAKDTQGWLEISEKARKQGKLRVIKMGGWSRDMLWTQTGLKWTPTSPAIPSFAAVIGYSMTGLGCQLGGFQHGYGGPYPFRFLTHQKVAPEILARDLKSKNIVGLDYSVKTLDNGKKGVYVIVTDWDKLRPTEISFYLMTLACQYSKENPFSSAKASAQSLFNKHTGSKIWWQEITGYGKNAPVNRFVSSSSLEALKFQEKSKKFWLYK